jgi:hypothetical protein
MYQEFARHDQIPLQELKERKEVEVFEMRPMESGDIQHIAKVGMIIPNHKEQLPLFITELGHYQIVLRIHWLRLHDVAMHFASNTVTCGSQYGITHCHDVPVTVQGVTEEPPEPVYQVTEIFEPQIPPLRPFRGNSVMLNGAAFFGMVDKGKLTLFKASLYDINKAVDAKDWKECP